MGTHPIFESDFDCLTDGAGRPDSGALFDGGEIGGKRFSPDGAGFALPTLARLNGANLQSLRRRPEAGRGLRAADQDGRPLHQTLEDASRIPKTRKSIPKRRKSSSANVQRSAQVRRSD